MEHITFGFFLPMHFCDLDGKTFQCEHYESRSCSRECQKIDFKRHKDDSESNKALKGLGA